MTLVLAAVVLVLFVLSVKRELRTKMHEGLSAEQVEEFERLQKVPIDVPEAWRKAEAWNDELLSATQALSRSWRAIEDEDLLARNEVLCGAEQSQDMFSTRSLLLKFERGEALDGEEWTSISRVLKSHASLLEETSRTVHAPSYDAALFTSHFHYSPDKVAVDEVATAARLFCLQAYEAALAQRWEEAFACARSVLMLAQRSEASGVHTHLASTLFLQSAARCTVLLAGHCPDSGALERHLEAMNRLDSRVNLNVLEKPKTLFLEIALLRDALREGYPLQIETGKPGIHYRKQLVEVRMLFASVMLERMAPGDPRRAALEEELSKAPPPTALKWGLRILQSLLEYVPDAHFAGLVPDFADAAAREKEAKARYDSARLALAARLWQLRGEETTPTLGALVGAYLPETPVDPFSGKEYLFDEASGRFYSVGPDARDDKLRVLYDPNNGAASEGDVVAR